MIDSKSLFELAELDTSLRFNAEIVSAECLVLLPESLNEAISFQRGAHRGGSEDLELRTPTPQESDTGNPIRIEVGDQDVLHILDRKIQPRKSLF